MFENRKFTAQEIVLKSIKDIQARQYTYPEVIVGSKPPNTQPPLICGRFTCICFELAAGDILFDPHIGENYERDEVHTSLTCFLIMFCEKKKLSGTLVSWITWH